MRYLNQESHADLGLIEDDNTPEMRRRAPAVTEALQRSNYPIPPHGDRTAMNSVTPTQVANDGNFSWRDVPGLTAADVELHETLEAEARESGGNLQMIAEGLLRSARATAAERAADARWAHVEAPGDATQVYGWQPYDGDRGIRYFNVRLDRGVELSGFQLSDGSVERSITVPEAECISADQARVLASALVDAAEELDRIGTGGQL